MKIIEKIEKIFDAPHEKEIDINFLKVVVKNQKQDETKWANHYSLVLRGYLMKVFGYSRKKLD